MHRDETAEETIDPQLIELVDDFARQAQCGATVDIDSFAERHPAHAKELRRLLPAVRALADFGLPTASEGVASLNFEPLISATALGDFRLLREVGRGGMGIVYEAEQMSLGRHVALKVLPFAAALDSRQLQRFKNEAQAVATLHHTHIVPVFAVGCERGVHYYAMQFIDGKSLATAIAELRQVHDQSARSPSVAITPTGTPSTTLHASGQRDRMRAIAQLGVQAAEALAYAHHMGIIHRDIKPANMLLDCAGHLWIADFGLARVQADANLTMTGDILGTLRYMSPEQALGQRELIDHRTDVYSLGATLYELLTLEPAYGATDRQQLLRQIANDEPKPLRRVMPSVPADLETIVLKTLSKHPSERYANSQEVADDLRRFLMDEPIHARCLNVLQRVAKWSRRHRSLVWTALACLLVTTTIVAATIGWAVRDQAARAAAMQRELDDAVSESQEHLLAGRWVAATSAARRASGLLSAGGGSDDDRRAAESLLADLQFVEQLDLARLSRGEGSNLGGDEEFLDYERTDAAYARAFTAAGLDCDRLFPADVGRRLPASPIRETIAMALDDWALVRLARQPPESWTWQRLLAIAGEIDSDSTRSAIRRAVSSQNREALREFAAAPLADDLPPQTALLLAGALMELGNAKRGVALLQRACARWRGDFWLNYMLGWYYTNRLRNEEAAIPYATAAASLRPDLPAPRVLLGYTLVELERPKDAIVECQHAIRLKSDFGVAHLYLCRSLADVGRLDEAVTAGQRAVELEPKNITIRCWYARTLSKRGRHDEAIGEFQNAIKLDVDRRWCEPHNWLGSVFLAQRRWHDAIAKFEEALRINPHEAESYDGLALALAHLSRFEESEAARRQAARLFPHDPERHGRLANTLAVRGKWGEAWNVLQDALDIWLTAAEFRVRRAEAFGTQGDWELSVRDLRLALRDRPGDSRIQIKLAEALKQLKQRDEAIDAYRAGVRPQFDHYVHYIELGTLLLDRGDVDAAVAAYAEAHRLNPISRAAQSHYGYGLCRQGKQEAGIEHLRKVLARDPQYALAKQLLDKATDDVQADLRPKFTKPAETHEPLGAVP